MMSYENQRILKVDEIRGRLCELKSIIKKQSGIFFSCEDPAFHYDIISLGPIQNYFSPVHHIISNFHYGKS